MTYLPLSLSLPSPLSSSAITGVASPSNFVGFRFLLFFLNTCIRSVICPCGVLAAGAPPSLDLSLAHLGVEPVILWWYSMVVRVVITDATLFDASQYAFFGQGGAEEAVLEGLEDEANDASVLGFGKDEYHLFDTEEKAFNLVGSGLASP